MYTHTYYVLDFSNFETNFFWRNVIFSSNLTLKTASGHPEFKDDMDNAAIMNVLMQSFSQSKELPTTACHSIAIFVRKHFVFIFKTP